MAREAARPQCLLAVVSVNRALQSRARSCASGSGCDRHGQARGLRGSPDKREETHEHIAVEEDAFRRPADRLRDSRRRAIDL
jgi:hypothetical protein